MQLSNLNFVPDVSVAAQNFITTIAWKVKGGAILSTYSLASMNAFEYLNQYGKYALGLRQKEMESE